MFPFSFSFSFSTYSTYSTYSISSLPPCLILTYLGTHMGGRYYSTFFEFLLLTIFTASGSSETAGVVVSY